MEYKNDIRRLLMRCCLATYLTSGCLNGSAVAGPESDALQERGTVLSVTMQNALAAYERRDYPRAVGLLRLAAGHGETEAAANLGRLLEEGRPGLSKDITEAAKWRIVAARGGDLDSQLALAKDYVEGAGVPENRPRAYFWATVGYVHATSVRRDGNLLLGLVKRNRAIASELSSQEISKAEILAHRCIVAKFKQCEDWPLD